MSYRLDGPGSFPSSILVFSVFFFLYFLFLVFCNVHVLVLYCENSCNVLCCFHVECMVFVTLPPGISPVAANNKYCNVDDKALLGNDPASEA
jgi:hypothetical protein